MLKIKTMKTISTILTLLLCCGGLNLTAAEARHIISVLLADGKEMSLENPFSRGTFDCGGFVIESELGLIDQVVQNDKGGWLVTYNNGLSLTAKSISGEIQYEGDFGQTKLSWATVKKMTTTKNENRQREMQNFSKDYYKHKIKLTFQDGNTIIVYNSENELGLPVKFKDNKAEVFPSKAHLVFDWSKSTVKASIGSTPAIELTLIELPQRANRFRNNFNTGLENGDIRCNTDLGKIYFNWNSVSEAQAVEGSSEPFVGQYTCLLSDGTKLAISNIQDTYSDFDWNYQKAHPRKINNQEVEKIFWNNISQIRMSETENVGSCVFSDGKECKISADVLRAEWDYGGIDIPFSSRGFTTITRNQSAKNVEQSKAFSHHLKFQSGETWDVNLTQIYGFSATTAEGVLHLVELPVAHGLWLTEKEYLGFAISENKMQVSGLSETYTVISPDFDKKVDVNTLYGSSEILLKSITSIEPIVPQTHDAGRKSVAITFNDGTKQTVQCSKVQFVRYPNRIYNGTYYNVDLGAWFWRQYDSITVSTQDSTTEVQLDRIKTIKVSGVSPSWNIEIEGTKTGAKLSGQLKPKPAATQSPGVASWDTDRDGFWFWSSRRGSFLFLRIKDIAEIYISPLS